ncbi:MAG: methyltransferase domain-containing protein, partial [Planctomycetota bacterium]
TAYIRRVFDEFAETFEGHLGSLGYIAPKQLALLMRRRLESASGQFDVLDVGCGTGLMADILRPYAKNLIGIDLSEGMLKKAKPKAYDQLHCREMVDYMVDQRDTFDLIVSADTFNYVGDLWDVLQAAHASLRSGGMLFFSVEKHEERSPEHGYSLNTNGRYTHVREYVETALRNAGFGSIECEEHMIRNEADLPVAGHYWSCVAT